MTKQQRLAAGVGGAFGLCVLALGWFLYSAYAEHQEIVEGGESIPEGLVAAKAKYSGFYQKNPFPSTESISQVKSNENAYATWKTDARKEAEKGDLLPPQSSLDSGDLKIMMSEQVTRMQKLTGSNNGHICAPTFQFGFEPYLEAEKKNEKPMPTEEKELLELHAQFVTITNLVDLLHANGTNGVMEIRRVGRPKLQEADPDANQGNPRRRAGKGKSAKGASVAEAPTCYDFELEYVARPSAFVKVLNELAKSPRFYVVRDFSFGHEGESLKERLNRAKTSSASGGDRNSGRRSRSAWGQVPEKQDAKPEVEEGLVTRPDKEPPIVVSMKLSVYDFGKGRASSQEEEGN